MEYVEIVQHGKNPTTIAEKSLNQNNTRDSEATMKPMQEFKNKNEPAYSVLVQVLSIGPINYHFQERI